VDIVKTRGEFSSPKVPHQDVVPFVILHSINTQRQHNIENPEDDEPVDNVQFINEQVIEEKQQITPRTKRPERQRRSAICVFA